MKLPAWERVFVRVRTLEQLILLVQKILRHLKILLRLLETSS